MSIGSSRILVQMMFADDARTEQKLLWGLQLWIKAVHDFFLPRVHTAIDDLRASATVMNDKEEAEWPEGTWLLRWVIRCIGEIVMLILFMIWLGVAGAMSVGSKVDCWLAPNRTRSHMCDEVTWVPSDSSYEMARMDYALHHDLTLEAAPPSCQSINATDVAANTSVAQECQEWCEHNLGRGAGAPIVFQVSFALMEPRYHEICKLFITCFKAEVAMMGAHIPNKWLVGLIYRGVGLLPAIILLSQKLKRMKLWRSTAEDSEDGESGTTTEDTEVNLPKGEGCECSGPPCLSDCCIGCCWQPPTDFCASRWALAKSAFSVLMEPLFDVFSIVTFLKSGQPFYFLAFIIGLVFSFVSSGDSLQAKGAMALVKSWHRGFPTKELLRHKRLDLPENIVSTFIQLYACLTLSSSDNPKNVIMFGVFGWSSLWLTLADATLCLDESLNYDDFYEVERARKEVKGKKYVRPVVLVAMVQSIQMISQFRQMAPVSRTFSRSSPWSLHVKVMIFLMALEVLLLAGLLCRECYSRYINGGTQRSEAVEQFGEVCLVGSFSLLFCLLFITTLPLHMNILVAHWEWIREIWKQSTWPPKLEAIAAMMQTVSRTAGVLAAGMVDCKLHTCFFLHAI